MKTGICVGCGVQGAVGGDHKGTITLDYSHPPGVAY